MDTGNNICPGNDDLENFDTSRIINFENDRSKNYINSLPESFQNDLVESQELKVEPIHNENEITPHPLKNIQVSGIIQNSVSENMEEMNSGVEGTLDIKDEPFESPSLLHEMQALQPHFIPFTSDEASRKIPVEFPINTQPSPVNELEPKSFAIPEPISVKKLKSKIKFNDLYLVDPRLKTWVRRVLGNPYKAECIICHTTMNCGRHSLNLHRNRKHHLMMEKALEERNKEQRPLPDIPKPSSDKFDRNFESMKFVNYLKHKNIDITTQGNIEALINCIAEKSNKDKFHHYNKAKRKESTHIKHSMFGIGESVGHYTLKRDKHCLSVLDQLLEDEVYADVTLTAEGHYVKAHKAVLCQSSNYFKRLFGSHSTNSIIVVAFCDIKIADLRSIIGYLYTGETTIDANQLDSFMKAAEMLEISSLCESGRSMTPSRSVEGEKTPIVNKPTAVVLNDKIKSPNLECSDKVIQDDQSVRDGGKINSPDSCTKLNSVKMQNTEMDDASNANHTSNLSKVSPNIAGDNPSAPCCTSRLNSRPKRNLSGVPIRAYSPFESSTKSSDYSDSDDSVEESSMDGFSAKKSSLVVKSKLKKVKGKGCNGISSKNELDDSPIPKKCYPKRKLKDDGGALNSDVSATSSTVRKKIKKQVVKSNIMPSNEITADFVGVKIKSAELQKMDSDSSLQDSKRVYKKKRKIKRYY